MNFIMCYWKIFCLGIVFGYFFVFNSFAGEDFEFEKFEYAHTIIWGSETVSSDVASKELRKNNAYERICSLYDEHMFVAAPFEFLVSINRDLYQVDNTLYITPVFGFLTDFWGRPMYDHAALLCEYYDEGSQKISANIYHLTMRNDWNMWELICNRGYSYRGYTIEEQSKEKIVELMMCHPKYKSKYVRYHPYKTFKIPKTEKTQSVLDNLKQLSKEDYYAYSLYGAKAAVSNTVKGSHNCISFIIDVLWQFGIFQEKHTLDNVLTYSAAYSLEKLSPYANLHWIIRRLIRIPETLKHLMDNPEMIRKECEFKVHPIVNMSNHRPMRERGAYARVHDELKRNIIGIIFKNNDSLVANQENASIKDVLDNLSESDEIKEIEETKDNELTDISENNNGYNYAKLPKNIYG